MSKNDIIQTPPNLNQQPRVDFDKSKFDAVVWNKGHEVFWERSIKCPCKREGGPPEPTCMNCRGIGYIYTDKIDTKMVIQAMNNNPKNKAWSLELMGAISVTAIAENQLGWMDRITEKTLEAVYTQVLYIHRSIQGRLFAFSVYPIIELQYAGLFQDVSQPLKVLNISNIETEDNVIYFDNADISDIMNPVITIRYSHKPTYNILDISREVMQTSIRDKENYGRETDKRLPIHATARRSQYIFDEDNLAQNLNQVNNIGDNNRF